MSVARLMARLNDALTPDMQADDRAMRLRAKLTSFKRGIV